MDKKLKKRLLLERNKRHHEINLHAEQHQAATERARAEEAKRAPSSPSSGGASQDAPVWSARLQEIRNKNTGRKRTARDRWNRFAGTEGGGGMGR